jgi:hypothetical protein
MILLVRVVRLLAASCVRPAGRRGAILPQPVADGASRGHPGEGPVNTSA